MTGRARVNREAKRPWLQVGPLRIAFGRGWITILPRITLPPGRTRTMTNDQNTPDRVAVPLSVLGGLLLAPPIDGEYGVCLFCGEEPAYTGHGIKSERHDYAIGHADDCPWRLALDIFDKAMR